MADSPFAQSDTIFTDETLFDGDRGAPDTLEGVQERQKQIDAFGDAFMSMAKGRSISDVLVYGHPGVGKTLITRLLTDHMKREAEKEDGFVDVENLRIIYLNCSGLDTSYKVTRELVNTFREPKNELSPTGYSAPYLYSELFDHVEEAPQSHILFVLDELDAIGQDDQLIYKLSRVHDQQQQVDPDKTEMGFIGIINDLTWRKQLKSTVQDTLTTTEIHFDSYNARQLERILEDRAEQAFHDGVFEGTVIQLAAAHAAKGTGSAREALDILKTAGKLARQDGSNMVTEEHVYEAKDKVTTSRIVQDLREMPAQAKVVMHAVLLADNNEKTPIPQSELYTIYKTLADAQWKADVQSKRSVDRRVQDLLSLGLVSINTVRDSSGGTHDTVDVGDIDTEKCCEGLHEELEANNATPNELISFTDADPSVANQSQQTFGNR